MLKKIEGFCVKIRAFTCMFNNNLSSHFEVPLVQNPHHSISIVLESINYYKTAIFPLYYLKMDFTFKTVDIYLVDLQIISYFLIIQILIFFGDFYLIFLPLTCYSELLLSFF